MRYVLRDDVTFCRVAGKHLFLDLNEDRYFGLSFLADRRFEALVAGGEAMANIPQCLAGLLISEDCHNPQSFVGLSPCRLPDQPTSTALDELADVGPSIRSIGMWSMLASTAWHLRRRNLKGLIADIRARKASGAVSPEDPRNFTLQAIWALQVARTLVTAENRCLLRSISLARYLANHGVEANLIFGVKLGPFSAHSWVQTDDRLLNDRYEIVRVYTPILVI